MPQHAGVAYRYLVGCYAPARHNTWPSPYQCHRRSTVARSERGATAASDFADSSARPDSKFFAGYRLHSLVECAADQV